MLLLLLLLLCPCNARPYSASAQAGCQRVQHLPWILQPCCSSDQACCSLDALHPASGPCCQTPRLLAVPLHHCCRCCYQQHHQLC
jgi:hypothetical protein